MDKTKRTNLKFNIIAIISIIIFAFAISPKTLQNDTFYTIKIGEYILKNGITMRDPFSWHNISYTYPHWAYDVIIYLIFNIGGQLGVYISTIVLTAVLGIIMYYTNDKMTKNKPISFVITIGAMFLLKDWIAARAQLVTFILFALELLFIESFLENYKKRYIVGLIIIPILLANLHVAVFPFYFILYLPYIAEYLVYLIFNVDGNCSERTIKKLKKKIEKCNEEKKQEKLNNRLNKVQAKLNKINLKQKEPYKIKVRYKKNTKILIIIMIICLFAGFVSPLGDVPYTYLIKTMQGNSTQNISEHLPLTLANNVTYAIILAFFLGILMFTDIKIRLCDLFMLLGLTVLTFKSRRQESMFIIMCIPILNNLITAFLNKYDKDGISQMTDIITSLCGTIVTISLVLILSILSYNNRFKDSYINESSYPIKASDWILENLDVNNIQLYNEYNYGSYLLYKDIPVFVDSRCDLYMPEFNEGVDVFNDFLKISNLNTRDIEGMFNKYGFTHFITYSGAKLTIYFDAKPNEYNKIYTDKHFCIYEKL